jgi:serine/threonine protein kinase
MLWCPSFPRSAWEREKTLRAGLQVPPRLERHLTTLQLSNRFIIYIILLQKKETIMILQHLGGNESPEQYIDIKFHAKGGMGEIYKAQDTANNNRTVAIKLIDVSDPEYKDLLQREIEISGAISGPNIVKTLFTGELNKGDQTYFYIVQDFYENGNLRSLIKQGIPFDECFRLMKEILNGLKTLHTVIVHRDIKPDNILIESNNVPVITDFGLAKYIDQKTRSRTYKGSGTLPYMSPECWLSEENSVSMDIYAMGILFYELLAGQLPASFKAEQEWRDFHIYGQIPDISNVRSDVSVKAKQILSKMTQKRVADRYKSVDEVLFALEEASAMAVKEKNELERLAALGHGSIERLQAERLQTQKENDKIAERKKHLNYHISELFDQIKTLVLDVNSRMELEKIVINESKLSNDPERRKLTVEFNGKRIEIVFPEYNYVETQEKERLKQHCHFQRKQFGYVLNPPEESYIIKKGIIYFGKLEANFLNPFYNEKFGFNVMLVQGKEELYGKWYVASFSDSAFSRSSRKNFSLDFQCFLSELPKTAYMHTLIVDYHELTQKDIISAIEELLR